MPALNTIAAPTKSRQLGQSANQRYDVGYHMDLRRLDCIVCGKYASSHQDLVVLDCEICKQFVLRQVDTLYAHRKIHRVCNNCAVSTDICRNDMKSTFCDRYAIRYECRFHNESGRELCHPKEYQFIATQRINKLHEPLQWSWRSDILTYQMEESQYLLRDGYCLRNDRVIQHAKVDNQYFRVFCKHKCVTCDRYLRRHWQTEQGRCKFCNNAYCIDYQRDEGGWSKCGSLNRTVCRHCYSKNERQVLRSAIYENVPQYLCLDICKIVYEYSIGFVIKCSNYARCKQEFCVASWLHLERYNWFDLDGKKTFKSYTARQAPKVRKKKQSNADDTDGSVVRVDGTYYRVLCKYDGYNDKHDHGSIVQECEWGRSSCDCDQHPERFQRYIGFGYHSYLCIQDAEIECDVCGKKEFVKKTWCTRCEADICLHCRQNGTHKKYCNRIEKINRNDFTMNDDLMEYDGYINYRKARNVCFQKRKHVNKPKKGTRAKTKNKQKRSSYWKRRNDRSSNVKLRIRRQFLKTNCADILLELQ